MLNVSSPLPPPKKKNLEKSVGAELCRGQPYAAD